MVRISVLCLIFGASVVLDNSCELVIDNVLIFFFSAFSSEKRVEESDNVRILQEGGRHSLVITHVSSDTEGFYTAVAQNTHGKSECTAELYMQEPRAAISSQL